jgi:uncharacterized protein YggU (UPF0235/DUF167 family)
MKARLTLKIRAGARKTEFAGVYGDGWKLHVAAPPVDGKANEAIIRFLAKLAGVPSNSVRIVTGFTGVTKIVEVEGVDPEHLHRLILRAILESNGHSPHTGSAAPPEA